MPQTSKQVMLINALEGGEVRIALLQENKLREFYIQRESKGSLVGNIFKGKVINSVPSLQACFVHIGLERNGFLHVSDVTYPSKSLPEVESVTGGAGGVRGPRRVRRLPTIDELVQPGQELLVQVVRDGIGEKGPSLSMDISIPGRYLVLTPRIPRLGISKKIIDPTRRQALHALLKEVVAPEGLGFIVRTAGADRPKRDLKRDLDYLCRLWKVVLRRAKSTPAPCSIYQESDLVIRTIRDAFTPDIAELLIDSERVVGKVREFFRAIQPRLQNRVKSYRGTIPLFDAYQVEEQIEEIYSRKVLLESGGSIVIETTEALTAIDVNSGRLVSNRSPEQMALQTNLEAVRAIARQLRLRDIGGQIIIDFIDLKEPANRRKVVQTLRNELRKDRSQHTILSISRLGLLEMARQKIRPGVKLVAYHPCPECAGSGYVKSAETMSLVLLRRLRHYVDRPDVISLRIFAHPTVAHHLLNRNRNQLLSLEEGYRKQIEVLADERLLMEEFELRGVDANQQTLTLFPIEPPAEPRKSARTDQEGARAAHRPSPQADPRAATRGQAAPSPSSEDRERVEPFEEVAPARKGPPPRKASPGERRGPRRRRRPPRTPRTAKDRP